MSRGKAIYNFPQRLQISHRNVQESEEQDSSYQSKMKHSMLEFNEKGSRLGIRLTRYPGSNYTWM